MAWDLAGYGIAIAAIAIAVAFVIGVVKLSWSLRHLDRAVNKLSQEAEASLRQCRQLADEARDAIVVSKISLQGFARLAEGARALGEAVQTAAQTAVHVTELYRDYLTSPFQSSTVNQDEESGESPDIAELGRRLWLKWKKRFGHTQTTDGCQSPGTGADPSRGE